MLFNIERFILTIPPSGYYVYQYIDPRSNNPFYIGKGKHKRYLHHMLETKENTENIKKWAYIQGLLNKNLFPVISIVKDNLIENDAYDLEERLIKQYGRKDIDENGILTNICIGSRPPQIVWNKERRELQKNVMKKITTELRLGGIYEESFKSIQAAQQLRIKNGTHNFQGINNPNHWRIKEGIHQWQGPNSNKSRLEAGTHPSQIKLVCPHCNLIGSMGNMKRWHFDNCKSKII